MNSKKLFLTSSGLSADMKKKFFDIIGKCPEDVKVLYIPTAGIETDGAREGFAVCFQELSSSVSPFFTAIYCHPAVQIQTGHLCLIRF